MKPNIFSGAVTIGGAIIFVIAVISLQVVQPQYDPIHQHMSELAQGRFGAMMFVGFCGFAISIFHAQLGLGVIGAPKTIRAVLACAAAGMAGAGIFKLDKAAEIHISLIALAFILLVISMYLLPLTVSKFSSFSSRIASWALATGTAISVALGGTIPDGIAQRVAAIGIISWLLWVGSRTVFVDGIDAQSRRRR